MFLVPYHVIWYDANSMTQAKKHTSESSIFNILQQGFSFSSTTSPENLHKPYINPHENSWDPNVWNASSFSNGPPIWQMRMAVWYEGRIAAHHHQ